MLAVGSFAYFRFRAKGPVDYVVADVKGIVVFLQNMQGYTCLVHYVALVYDPN